MLADTIMTVSSIVMLAVRSNIVPVISDKVSLACNTIVTISPNLARVWFSLLLDIDKLSLYEITASTNIFAEFKFE